MEARIPQQVKSGKELMENGIANPLSTQFDSAVLKLSAIN